MIYFWIGVAILFLPVFDAAKKYGWRNLAEQLGAALADHLEDGEGWHGEDRQKKVLRLTR